MRVQPVTLEGKHVRLEPLSLDHHDALSRVGLDDDLWRLSPTVVESAEDMRRYLEAALQAQGEGTALPFVILERGSGTVVGSTRYGNIDRANRRVEIGWTWIARPWQRTAVNTECKYLLLRHAFETLGCIRVEFKTDMLNERSRQAILRIGAKEEGIFRNHMVTSTGRIRDSVYFSIVDREWPGVRARLEEMLERSAPNQSTAT
ncbi:MAG: GNAT family N-acetyltransferase [Gemmatimonadales bacterium]